MHGRDKREPTDNNKLLTERRRGLHLRAPLANVGDQRARVGVPSIGHQQPEELRSSARAGGRAAQLAPAGRGAEGADLGDEGGRHSSGWEERERGKDKTNVDRRKDDDD